MSKYLKIITGDTQAVADDYNIVYYNEPEDKIIWKNKFFYIYYGANKSVNGFGNGFSGATYISGGYDTETKQGYAKFDGKPTSIRDYAFSVSNTELTSIEIPDSVTSIGIRAFQHCTGLTSIEIPDSVTSIGTYAFTNCNKIKTISVGKGLTTLGSYVFCGCFELISIELPDSVTYIPHQCFLDCYKLASFNIHNSVTFIDRQAFKGC